MRTTESRYTQRIHRFYAQFGELVDGVTRFVSPAPSVPMLLHQIGPLLADHYHRRVYISAGDRGHDGRVDHPQPLHPVHPELGIDDGRGIGRWPHLSRAAHMVNGHRVLANGTVPILVREQRYPLAVGQGFTVESRAEPLHAARLAERDGRFHSLPQHVDVAWVGKVVVIHERIVEGIARLQLDEAARMGPEQHGEHAEHVAPVHALEHLVVKFVRQPVRVLHVGATVRVDRGRGEHELDVRPVVASIRVLGRDETDRLEAHVRGQRPVLGDRVSERRIQVHHTVEHDADRIVYGEDEAAHGYVVLEILANARRVVDHGDPDLLEMAPRPDPGQHQQLGRVYRPGR